MSQPDIDVPAGSMVLDSETVEHLGGASFSSSSASSQVRPRQMTCVISHPDSVLSVAMTVIDSRMIRSIVDAAKMDAPDHSAPHPVEAVLVKLLTAAAREWEPTYAPVAEFEEVASSYLDRIDRLTRTLAATRAELLHTRTPILPTSLSGAHLVSAIAARPRGASPAGLAATASALRGTGAHEDAALPSQCAAGASSSVAGKELWEKDQFWCAWGDWPLTVWSRDVERAVREGVKRDVIDKIDNLKEKEDLDVLLSAALAQMAIWRGQQPTDDQVKGVTQDLMRRFWYRHLAAAVPKGQRGLAITAAASSFESSGLTQQQRDAKASALRAVLLGQGVSYAHADVASGAPGADRFASDAARRTLPTSGRGSGAGRGTSHANFRGACHGCRQVGHFLRDCPNGQGRAAAQSRR